MSPTLNIQMFFFHYLFDEFLAPINYEKIALGSDVIFVGYPENRYDVVNNLPLIRKGSIASMPNINFNGKGQIVIDAQIFPGSSGSPVFVDWDGKYSITWCCFPNNDSAFTASNFTHKCTTRWS